MAITREGSIGVERSLEEECSMSKHTNFAQEARARITKYIVESGNSVTVRHFSKEFPLLGESTVYLYKKYRKN